MQQFQMNQCWHPRRLRKAMLSALPDDCREEAELIPGGDLRLAGSTWLRKVWDECKIKRVPRENEIRKVVHQLVNLTDICPLFEIICTL